MQPEGYTRLSFTNQQTPQAELYRGIFHLSYLNTGDQTCQINNTHDQFVLHHKWLSETQFKQVLDLCWNLPGPTTIQIILTIVTLKCQSLVMGVRCFFIYNCLPWIILTFMGLLSTVFIQGNAENLSDTVKLVFMGCNAAAAGIMARSFLTYFGHFMDKWTHLLIIVISSGLFFYYKSVFSILLSLASSGIIALYLQIEEGRRKMSFKSQDLFSKISFNFILGKLSLLILGGLFLVMWLYFSIYEQHPYIYVFGFYCVSCLIIGPIDVIFAYFLAILLPFSHLDPMQIWIGIPLCFLLPGTQLNVGIYFGAMLDGLRGALLAAIFLYLPCFLSVYGILPSWKNYRDRQGVQRLYQGIVCSTTGLTLAMILLILQHCFQMDTSTPLCIFVLSIFLNYLMNRYACLIILLGGLLAYVRHIGLVCYRESLHCPLPFVS